MQKYQYPIEIGIKNPGTEVGLMDKNVVKDRNVAKDQLARLQIMGSSSYNGMGSSAYIGSFRKRKEVKDITNSNTKNSGRSSLTQKEMVDRMHHLQCELLRLQGEEDDKRQVSINIIFLTQSIFTFNKPFYHFHLFY